MSLTPRQRVKTLFSHQIPDQMPVTLDVGGGLGVTDLYQQKVLNPLKIYNVPETYDFDIRVVEAPLTSNNIDPNDYFTSLSEPMEIDAFGVGRVYTDSFPHGIIHSPLEKVKDLNRVIDYPLPTFELTAQIKTQIQKIQERGYAVSMAGGSINEWCYYLRSMEVFFEDLVLNPQVAEVILEKVCALSSQLGAALAGAGADIVCFYGDVGGQHGMLMSPAMWRKWIKPRWDRIFSSVRMANKDTLIFFHSCGDIAPIIPDLIEIGVNILNPVQPESMDPIAIKEAHGREINLWGGIGLQETMSQADPEEVRRKVRELINAWGFEGGGLVTTTNSLPLDIPWQNVETLIQTIREVSPVVYRQYRS